MQHFYLYPEDLAKKTQKVLTGKRYGWAQEDIQFYSELTETLKTYLHQINTTLVSLYWRPQGKYHTVWNIKISTPGHCDIFQLINAIMMAFDLNGIDDRFTFINVDLESRQVFIEFTASC